LYEIHAKELSVLFLSAAGYLTGSRMVNVVPLPQVLSTAMVPFMLLMMP
jgi:hypothetical protein